MSDETRPAEKSEATESDVEVGGPEPASVESLDVRLSKLRLSSPAQMTRLRTSVERVGVRNPIVVSTGIAAGTLVVVDGFKRVRIARELGMASLVATKVSLDLRASQVAMMQCNAPHRGLCDLEEAWIVHALCRSQGLSQAEVGQLLRRHKSWVCRRLKLVEHLESCVVDDIRLGLLSSTVARELSRLPRGNQVPAASAIRTHGLTSRQAHELVCALLAAKDPDARRAVLTDPLRWLVAAPAAVGGNEDPRLGVGGNAVRRSLLAMDGVAARLCRTLEQHAPSGLGAEQAPVLAPLVGQALRAVARATTTLQTVAADSGFLRE